MLAQADLDRARGSALARAYSLLIFPGVELRNGNEFSSGNVEIDATAPSSPAGIEVVAEIPHLLGRGLTAQMTYDETRRGAKVFAAGAFSRARNLTERAVRQLLANLWRRLAADVPYESVTTRD